MSPQSTTSVVSAYAELAERMERYFEAFHHSDAGKLAQLFHPRALYAFADGEALQHLDMATYLPIVAARPAPALRGENSDARVLSIELAGERTALVKAACRMNGKRYLDFLSFLRIEGRWQIVAKVFHLVSEESAPCRT
ncbi:MAG: nuclear transport factor 2 family protein [Planctomycetes bacterium]|nr:nuclear transport factor 2 family protein [Planctomycetota bacterium]